MKSTWLFLMLPLLGCLDDKGLEDDVPTDGKLDSFRKPTDHGAIAFATPAVGKITADEGFHTWTFSLSGDADIRVATARVPHEASIDTVLYLYKKPVGGTSWGPYIARNDDDGRADWSSIAKSLDAGEYRVLVKGFSASTRGKFAVTVDCTGAACAPQPTTCVFGSSFYELRYENPSFEELSRDARTSPAGLSTLDQQRAVIAMNESTHQVTTAAEAFDAADQNEIVFTRLRHTPTGREFVMVDYGAGDNTYGAIFTATTTEVLAGIHDGDFYRCSIQ